ncbi:hypothetical protein F5Y16DRAFT_406579 [Xylariaceae sp. FL0255]|nr:hypothetical protein F5Y16DRAFT_406579 [Xylariaceae sp. FL0255]
MDLHSLFDKIGSALNQVALMEYTDRILYTSCWVILMLYVIATLRVFYRRSCIGTSMCFLFACVLWIDFTIFNLWFFMPALMLHLRRLADTYTGDNLALLQSLFTSEAAEDWALMMLGWFGSCLSISNAVGILQAEGCDAIGPHSHCKHAHFFIKFVYKVRDYTGLDFSPCLPLDTNEIRMTKRKSWLFAIPRWVHSRISQAPKPSVYPSAASEKQLLEQETISG